MKTLAKAGGVAAVAASMMFFSAPGAVAAATFPAHGGWDCDVWWADWSASASSQLTVEPHTGNKSRAVVARYYGSTIVYYYGPWVTQGITGHLKSSVSGASNGTWVADYWQDHGGVRHLLWNGGTKNQYCS